MAIKEQPKIGHVYVCDDPNWWYANTFDDLSEGFKWIGQLEHDPWLVLAKRHSKRHGDSGLVHYLIVYHGCVLWFPNLTNVDAFERIA